MLFQFLEIVKIYSLNTKVKLNHYKVIKAKYYEDSTILRAFIEHRVHDFLVDLKKRILAYLNEIHVQHLSLTFCRKTKIKKDT